MPILIGLDEAGYSPTLGPLVVAATSFRFDEPPPDDLWSLLQRSVTRAPRIRDRRIPIADSKTIFSTRKGIGALEETVLAATLAARPDGDDGPGATPGAGPVGEGGLPCPQGLRFEESDDPYPWYRGALVELPVKADLLRVRPRAERFAGDLADHGAAYLGARVAPVEALEFNRGLSEKRNKSVLLFEVCSRLLRGCLSSSPGERIRIVADRHGGRKSYLPLLGEYLGDLDPSAVREGPLLSEYSLAGGRVVLSFEVRADGSHLPVALASMIAKYVREIRMGLFNRFWAGRIADLRPTSGYPQDARRFLQAIRPSLRRLEIPRECLVRSR